MNATKHSKECLSQRFLLKYGHKSIAQKNMAINQLIDDILKAEANPEAYDEEYLEIPKLEAKIIAEMLLRLSS